MRRRSSLRFVVRTDLCLKEFAVRIGHGFRTYLLPFPREEKFTTTNSKSIVFFSAQNEIFVYVGIIHAENLFDI